MHKLYLAECKRNGVDKPVGLTKYKEILDSENIKIHQPKKEQCKICTKYNRSNDEEKKELEVSQQTHNFDLEAVLYTPCDKVSTIYYKRKLCTYNATTFNLVSKAGHCYIWDESEGKRGSNEIGISILRHLEKFKGREVVMFSDTCGGQNRNQYMAALLLHIAQSHSSIESIDYIFMVQGHSHMEVDSMHSAIERKSGIFGKELFQIKILGGFKDWDLSSPFMFHFIFKKLN